MSAQTAGLRLRDEENPVGSKGTLKRYSESDYERFVEEYNKGQANKESKKLWNARIVEACRQRLASDELFSGDFDLALKYCYACRRDDPDRIFLWDVFETNEILRNVYSKR